MEGLLKDRIEQCTARLVVQIPLARRSALHTFHPILAKYLNQIRMATDRMWQEGTTQRLRITEGELCYDLVLQPTGSATGLLLAWDLSSIVALQRDMKQSLFQVYRDALYAGTGGRFNLVHPEELSEYVGIVEECWDLEIKGPAEIPLAREMVMAEGAARGLPRKELLALGLAVTEAVTNAVKHAGSGQFRLLRTESGCAALIRDNGRGLDLSILPTAVLLPGFSTIHTMGLGFPTMLRCVDRVVVASTEQGTAVLLEWRETDLDRSCEVT